MSNPRDNQNISENVKNAAGAAFHGVHRALEATENAAMSAVDATANAVSNLKENVTDEENPLD